MKRHFFGAVGALAVVALLAGCNSDPTSSLRGGVDRVVISRTYVELDVGQTLRINAKSYDEQGNVLTVLPEVSVSDAAIATVTVDTVTSGDPLPQTDFVIEAVAPGSVEITATAGGVSSEPTEVIAFPTAFAGTVSVAASGLGWDIITVAATANVKFDPDETLATINEVPAFIHSITADEIQLVSSDPAAVTGGTLRLFDLVFLGEFAADLDASTSVDVAAFQNYLDEDYDLAAAPDLTAGPFPLVIYGIVSEAKPDVIGKFAPAADLTMSSSVYWLDEDTDIDVFYTDAGDGFIDCLGCGGSNPETGSWTVAGSDTNYYYVELWDGAPTMFQITITSP
jgi:hypothetical protein